MWLWRIVQWTKRESSERPSFFGPTSSNVSISLWDKWSDVVDAMADWE
jgi:hypothetical protein